MYYFLTSRNQLVLPDTSIARINSHSFDTATFIEKLKTTYPVYREFVKDRNVFERQVDAFAWFADRLYWEAEAEFFFNVRLYESVFHREFDRNRSNIWSKSVRPYISKNDLNEQASESMNQYLRSRASRFPPALMRIEYDYHFLALTERRYFIDMTGRLLQNRVESTGLSETLLAHDVLGFFQKNIPVLKLLGLLDAASGNQKADYVYLLCKKLFFDTVVSAWAEADSHFEKVWSDIEDPRTQLLKGGFVDLLTGLLKSPEATRDKLEVFIKSSVNLFHGILEQDKRGAYLYMVEALRSGFPFGRLGETTKEQLGKMDLSERFSYLSSNITPFV